MDDNTWSARAEEYSMYGFTDLPSVERRGTIVLTHGEGPYVCLLYTSPSPRD